MKFSVVVPLYNKAAYIEGAVRSALAQTYSDFEVIVIDDGSSDGGDEIVARIDDPRVTLVRQENAGVSVTRNRGIAMAKGQWVAFLDADDWHHPRFLEMLVLAQTLYPEADMVGTTYVSIPDSESDWLSAFPHADETPAVQLILDFPARWIQSPLLNTSTVAIRTQKLSEMQPCFAPGESWGEDVDLWLRVGESSPIAVVDMPFVAYRIAMQDSLSAMSNRLVLPPFLKRLKRRSYHGEMSHALRQSSLRLVAYLEVTIARDALSVGERLKAMKLLLNASHAGRSRRWWTTAGMVFLFPSTVVRRWQAWRVSKTANTVSAG